MNNGMKDLRPLYFINFMLLNSNIKIDNTLWENQNCISSLKTNLISLKKEKINLMKCINDNFTEALTVMMKFPFNKYYVEIFNKYNDMLSLIDDDAYYNTLDAICDPINYYAISVFNIDKLSEKFMNNNKSFCDDIFSSIGDQLIESFIHEPTLYQLLYKLNVINIYLYNIQKKINRTTSYNEIDYNKYIIYNNPNISKDVYT